MITFDFEAGRQSLFPRGYTQKQVDVINAIVSEANTQGVRLATQVAYMLATTYHECYNPEVPTSRMTQLIELGSQSYLRNKKYWPWIGRGPSHITWKENYRKEGTRLNLDLVKHPELMEDIRIGANSHVYCMMNGIYTGAKLTRFVHSGKTDFPGARAVINGSDKAELIAGYAMKFLKCLVA